MQSSILAIYLFVVIFSVFCWFITPAKKVQEVTTNINELETPVLEKITTQEVVLNELINHLQTGETITEKTPIVQEVLEKLVDDKPIKESQNEKSKTQEPRKKISEIDLKNVKTYLLHKHRCVKIKDLPSNFQLLQDTKTYNLRGEKVIRLTALEALLAI